MNTLHTFGCSITQGFALPDVVKPITDSKGRPLTDREVYQSTANWEHIHIYAPSQFAWPQVLADQLGTTVHNHARRGACFQQIARQCAVNLNSIQPEDTVIVMWTYISRLSLQWPARTAVPFCHIVDTVNPGFRTNILQGFNKCFGLSQSTEKTKFKDASIHKYLHSVANNHLDPKGMYNHIYNNLVLQICTDGLLRSTGATVLHLSVEVEPSLDQLAHVRAELQSSLQSPVHTPDPTEWYNLEIDHNSSAVLHDPSIPPAENDMHPSVQHHKNFANTVRQKYFSD